MIHNALAATLDAGDEVVVPTPCWPSYPDVVRFLGGRPRLLEAPAASGFKLTAPALAESITDRTRWLLLNTPNNPTGAVYCRADLEAIAAVLRRHPGVWVLSDEIYEHVLDGGVPHLSLAAVAPDLADRILTVNGVSKAYAMTGWRIGFAGGPAPLIEAMARVQSQVAGSPCSVSQLAAAAALTGPQELLASRAADYRERRDLAASILDSCARLACHRGQGAFYLFVSCADTIGCTTPGGTPIDSDVDLVNHLLDHAGVAVVPGTAFGAAPYFRICYAVDLRTLEQACARVVSACESLRP